MKTGIVSNSALCLPLLHYLKTQQEQLAVFSAENAPPGQGAVASFCAGAGIPCTHANGNKQALYDWVALAQPDIVFVIGYSYKILAERFTTGAPLLFNVHMGHLPAFRGPNPVFWQLKKGASSLAVTIHCITHQFDAGDVVWKKEYANEPFFNYGYVHQLMSHHLVEGVHYIMQLKKQGQPVPATAQNEQQAAYFKQPVAADVCIRWDTMQATEICDLIKACNPWNGGAITSYNGIEVRISDAERLPAVNTGQPLQPSVPQGPSGTIIHTQHELLVACLNKEVLKIHTLTVNGIPLPGRFAIHYGFSPGQSFKNI